MKQKQILKNDYTHFLLVLCHYVTSMFVTVMTTSLSLTYSERHDLNLHFHNHSLKIQLTMHM
jgi:calcineurin-like phosphoesterase family protein